MKLFLELVLNCAMQIRIKFIPLVVDAVSLERLFSELLSLLRLMISVTVVMVLEVSSNGGRGSSSSSSTSTSNSTTTSSSSVSSNSSSSSSNKSSSDCRYITNDVEEFRLRLEMSYT